MNGLFEKPAFRYTAVVIGVILFFIFVYAARAALFPFIVAFGFAYILNPLVERMEKFGVGRVFSIILILMALFGALAGIIAIAAPVVTAQAHAMANNVPRYIETVKGKVIPLMESLPDMDREKVEQAVRDGMAALGDAPIKAVKGLTSLIWSGLENVMGVALAMFNIVIIPVATFYLLKDFNVIIEKLGGLTPPSKREIIFGFMKKIDQILGALVRGQLAVASIMAVFYSIGLLLIGVPMGLAIGIAAGLSNIVPYLPILAGLVPSLILAWLQYPGPERVLMVAALFAAGLAMEGMVITPRTLEKSVGLHPVAVMAALFIGGAFFGFIGVLLAMPAAAVIKVALMEMGEAYKHSDFYTGSEEN